MPQPRPLGWEMVMDRWALTLLGLASELTVEGRLNQPEGLRLPGGGGPGVNTGTLRSQEW